jgi:hypothetical protein
VTKRIAVVATAWTLLVGSVVSAVASERAPRHQRRAIPVRLVPVSRDEQARQTVRVADFMNGRTVEATTARTARRCSSPTHAGARGPQHAPAVGARGRSHPALTELSRNRP